MKKALVLLLVIAAILSIFAGCGSKVSTDNVSGLSEEQTAMLEEMGIDPNEFAEYSEEEQAAILGELSAVAEEEAKNQEAEEEAKTSRPKLEDIQNGGNYVVTVSDSMWWNYIEFYYENGVLVKIYVHFMKSSGEEPEEYTYEGDAISEFTFNFMDYQNATPQEIVDSLTDYGYTETYVETY